MSENPVLTAIPYLPLQRPVPVGPWTISPLSQFDGPWASDEFETATRTFLGAFRTPTGDAVRNPAVVARDGALDGRAPSPAEVQALTRAIGFAVVNENPWWGEDTRYLGHQIATSDNTELWIQPLDLVEHRITLERGSRVHTVVGGHRLTDDGFTIPAPLELNLPFAVGCDEVAAAALYTVLRSQGQPHQIGTAVDWLLKSWRNSPSITQDDRIVFLKTALEALTGVSPTATAGAALLALFSDTALQEGEGIGVDRLLWSPQERTLTRTWTYQGKPGSATVTELEHWYGALADTRNQIIHDGTSGSGRYAEPGSSYSGPISEVADRIVREAIAVSLGTAGHPDVWRRGLSRASLAAYRALCADD